MWPIDGENQPTIGRAFKAFLTDPPQAIPHGASVKNPISYGILLTVFAYMPFPVSAV